jgi:outer membrane protein TolC
MNLELFMIMMKLYHTKTLFLASLIMMAGLSETPAQEDEKGDIDLRRSVILALKNNYRVQVDTINVEESDQRTKAARGAFDPELTTEVAEFRDSSGSKYVYGKGTYQTAGVSGDLPTGTTYSVGAATYKMYNTPEASSRESGLYFSLRQNLFKGFGLGANLAPIRVASKNAAISRQVFAEELSQLVTDVQFAYFDTVLAQENARVAKESLDLANRLYEENKKRESIGSMAGSDIFQAQSEVAARRENLYEAERMLGDAENAMKFLMAPDAASLMGMNLTLVTLPAAEKVAVDAKSDYARALELRPDYLQAVLGLERDEIDALRASNAALPDLDAFAESYYFGTDSDYGSSFKRARHDDEPDFAVGLVFSYSIPNRKASAEKAIAKREIRRSKYTLKHLELQIALELDNGARRIDCDWNRVVTARESRKLAEQSLEAEQKLYDTGNSSTFVILRLQTDLMNAQLRELSAENDYRKALVEYQRILGASLLAYNIVTP